MSTFTIASQVFQDGQWLGDFAHTLNQLFVFIKLIIIFLGALIIFTGAVIAAFACFKLIKNPLLMSSQIRLDLAKSILLGLEFFIAADVIETTIAFDFESLGILAALVVIRTILNFSLEREIGVDAKA